MSTTITTTCPKCGVELQLELPPGADLEAAEHLAKLVLCGRCAARPPRSKAKLKPEEARLPYADA
jgi:hypothetical protein